MIEGGDLHVPRFSVVSFCCSGDEVGLLSMVSQEYLCIQCEVTPNSTQEKCTNRGLEWFEMYS